MTAPTAAKLTELDDFCKPQTWLAVRTNRRCGWDNHPENASTAATFVRLAMIRLMLKRLTRPTNCSWIKTLRIGSYRSRAFILAKAISIGLKSGL
jgi:hypothetical protein